MRDSGLKYVLFYFKASEALSFLPMSFVWYVKYEVWNQGFQNHNIMDIDKHQVGS